MSTSTRSSFGPPRKVSVGALLITLETVNPADIANATNFLDQAFTRKQYLPAYVTSDNLRFEQISIILSTDDNMGGNMDGNKGDSMDDSRDGSRGEFLR